MTVAEIKEYAQTIAGYIKNYREVCREENTNEELIPTTPLQNDIEHLVSMLDELEPEAKWKHDGSQWKNRFICSKCGHKIFEEQQPYCSNCGARMDEPKENNK